MKDPISQHLEQALGHLNEALKNSVDAVSKDATLKAPVGELWEQFLAGFFDSVRLKSRESKLNLLSWMSFAKIWRG